MKPSLMPIGVRVSVVCLLLTAGSCHVMEKPEVSRFSAEHYPVLLSAWGIVTREGERLVLGERVLPYDLNTPLFTDYAHKLRTIWMPLGTSAHYQPDDSFDFPTGTIFSKTFYYPRGDGAELLQTEDYSADFSSAGVSSELDLGRVQLIETRLLVKQPGGWDALPYVWNEQQQDAVLEIAGDMQQLSLRVSGQQPRRLNYIVPTRNECASCHASNHTSGKLLPIGPKARHLNKDYAHLSSGNPRQLKHWVEMGYLGGVPSAELIPAAIQWEANRFDQLEQRSRAYLDINCAHCHNPEGAADTSGLFLHAQETDSRRLGLCKPPVAAGRGSGNRTYSLVPGHPEDSILTFRMSTNDPAEMMPELGRSSIHREGVALIEAWIRALPGGC